MKKNIIYISALAYALLLSACERVEEIDAPVSGKMEEMKFFASIESGADTKTMIDGNVGDETRYLKWLPEDAIGVYNKSSKKFEKFVNVNTETSASGVFEGENTVQDVYYAVYPYSELHSYADRDKIMTVDLPAVQNYAENTFGNGANPMVAHAESGEELMFQNLCGVLVINLTGDVSVKSMTISLLDESGNHAPVSGKHTVSMDYIESPTLKSTEESLTSVTLDCGEGVALNAAESTPFHVVLPAGTYSGITVSVLTTDGGIMVKKGKNSLRIRRSRVTSAGAFEHQSEIAVDLSERGTSNSYIVSEPGVYSFDATTIGNGEFGLVPGAGFHTDDSKINPSSVELLWEDRTGVVQSLFYKEGKISFYSEAQGNALIAAKDESGTILWSWHIWATDRLKEQLYVTSSGTYMVLDRNLGSVRTETGIDCGLYYQWGRKDPFNFNYMEVQKEANEFSIEDAVLKPTIMSTNYFNDSASSERNWMNPVNERLWHYGMKTVYDPCPVGYKIVCESAFAALTGAPEVLDNGYEVALNDSDVVYFPISYFWNGRGNKDAESNSYCWTSSYGETFRVNGESTEIFDRFRSSPAVPVRCMKDEGYVDISLPQVHITSFDEITSSSAKVYVNIKSEGISPVTEKGIIYGIQSDLADGIRVECNEESVVELTGLTNYVKYFVKPYAINGRGESYGPVKAFHTRYSDDIINLSALESANCYIVQPLPSVRYSFDCTVRGNSSESVGTPASLEILWEADGCSSIAESGTIISSVEIINNELAVFELSGEPKEGNALIAAKDNDGTILWSWHIWVTDKPEAYTYKNSQGTYTLMDRNIGASSASVGTDDRWEDSVGMLYQWGRKDPFFKDIFSTSADIRTIEASIQSPVCHAKLTSWNHTYHWESNNDKKLWCPEQKTLYDPCPPGYMAADINAYYDVSVVDDSGTGYYVKFNESVTLWFPVTPLIHCGGHYEEADGDVIIWSSSTTSNSFSRFHIDIDDESVDYWGGKDNAAMTSPVRCMKE